MKENMFLENINKQKLKTVEKIRKCNEYTQKYGLVLSEQEIANIMERRIDSLKDNNRIELGEGIIDKIILEFCDSPYISNNNYAQTLYELIDIFYLYKNETYDLVPDDELIKYMKQCFDGISQGSLEYLASTELDKLVNRVVNPKPLEDDKEEYLEENEDE